MFPCTSPPGTPAFSVSAPPFPVDHCLGVLFYPVIPKGAWVATTEFKLNLIKPVSAGACQATTQVVALARRSGVARIFSSLAIAMLVARPLLGNFDQAFQYIQEFTGFFTPGTPGWIDDRICVAE